MKVLVWNDYKKQAEINLIIFEEEAIRNQSESPLLCLTILIEIYVWTTNNSDFKNAQKWYWKTPALTRL